MAGKTIQQSQPVHEPLSQSSGAEGVARHPDDLPFQEPVADDEGSVYDDEGYPPGLEGTAVSAPGAPVAFVPVPHYKEPPALAFANFFDARTKQEWGITIRSTARIEDLTHLLDLIQYFSRAAEEAGLYTRLPQPPVTAQPKPAATTEPATASTATTGQPAVATGQGPTKPATAAAQPKPAQPPPLTGNQPPQHPAKDPNPPLQVGRVVVTGTVDAPVVEMYSKNASLKWPVIKAPVTKVVPILAQQLGADEDGLRGRLTPGQTFSVDWLVHWMPSPKNDKWKDLLDITVVNSRRE